MPKNIVILSDGTGNSSAQLLKTNVWRIYEALQLNDPTQQVACYDDGVGTSGLAPVALIGGVFGVGLRRNVLRLYRFLCEHYDPGDRIYLFGFSRGAFTIRVLVGLICDQGIIRTRPTLAVEGASNVPAGEGYQRSDSARPGEQARLFDGVVYGDDLARLARWAYREFRKNFNQTGGLVTAARHARDLAFRATERARGLRAYDRGKNHQVRAIDFLGLMDTVDAYGLPVDELTQGIDRWFWPLSMPELELSPKVKRACHVLALDDERNTFHPVLWNEENEPAGALQATHLNDERISQVWFAGMHANVGGGYPDDALSYVSLKWLVEQATDTSRGMPLLFVPELIQYHTSKADPLGRLYDSRSGLKGYYRYNPRRVEWLTNGQAHESGFSNGTWPKPFPTVTIPRPKIHESVFQRIASAPEAYAPIVLPPRYAVVMDDGRIVEGDDNPYEHSRAAARRADAQEGAWDLVWWRRAVYFAVVAITILLVIRPFLPGAHAAVAAGELGVAARFVSAVAAFTPWFLSPWMDYYRARPYELLIGVALVLSLRRISGSLQGRICGLMRGVWLNVIPPATAEYETLPSPRSRLMHLRRHPWYQGTFAVLRRKVIPNTFSLVIFLAAIVVANRVSFDLAHAMGAWCHGTSGGGATLAVGTSSAPLPLASADFCAPTGVRLEAGSRYQLDVRLPEDGTWRDGDVPVTSTAGVSGRSPGLTPAQRTAYTAFAPFRRLWSANWFVPVARIDETGIDHYHLSTRTTEITARTTGELFLFVNDAVAPVGMAPPWLGWTLYYPNNQGRALVTVRRLSAREEGTP